MYEMVKAPKPVVKRALPRATNGGPKAPDGGAAPTPVPEAASVAATAQPGTQPSMRVLAQYLKDLSFENPNAPQSLAPQQTQPEINISVNVNARNLAPTDFEVTLHLDAKAKMQDKVTFAAEVLYAGVFRMENFPPNVLHAAVLIECPRILFPFARQVLADATRSGGFPPLMLDPIDFAQMYQRRMAQQTSAQA
jgi:preprotein translocase subunit SecB